MTQTPAEGFLGRGRKHPWQLAAGYIVGVILTSLAWSVLGFVSLIVPLTLSGATAAIKRTAAFSIGVFAAFSGLLTFAVMFCELAML